MQIIMINTQATFGGRVIAHIWGCGQCTLNLQRVSPSEFGTESEVNTFLKNETSVGNLGEGFHVVGKGGSHTLPPFHRSREML